MGIAAAVVVAAAIIGLVECKSRLFPAMTGTKSAVAAIAAAIACIAVAIIALDVMYGRPGSIMIRWIVVGSLLIMYNIAVGAGAFVAAKRRNQGTGEAAAGNDASTSR